MNNHTESIAYCWQNGEVEIGTFVPDGAFGIARGNEGLLHKSITLYAVHGWRRGIYLVPNLPLATTEDERLESVNKFRDLINGVLEQYTLPEGVHWDGSAFVCRCPDCGHQQGDTGKAVRCEICGANMPTLDGTSWPTCLFCAAPAAPDSTCSANCELSRED